MFEFTANAQTRLPEPLHISFRALDGRNLQGEVRSWDAVGFDGTFGRVEWKHLDAGEAWHAHVAMIDPDIAEHWLSVGRVLAAIDDGQVYAERALRWASWLARTTGELANQMIRELPPTPEDFALPMPHGHREEAKIVTEPWPDMTDQQRAETTAQLKGEIDGGLKAMGMTMLLYEQDYALVYSDLPKEEIHSLLLGLATTYETLLKSFRLPLDRNVFWGKLVVIACKEQDTFARISRQLFRSNVAPQMAGHHIPRGPKSYLVLWNFPDHAKFQATIPHEFTHAFMYRYRSPAQVPLWMDEGFADFVASLVLKDSPVDKERRSRGEWFIRHGGPVENILEMQCMNEGWPGPFHSCYGVSYLLVQEMFLEAPTKALACMTAIKDGKSWEQALAEDLGVTRAQLVERLTKRVFAANSIDPP